MPDRLSGESGEFIGTLHRHHREDVVAIRSHQGVWMLPGQRLRRTRWPPFDRVFTDGSRERRFIGETIFGTRQAVRSYPITTDPLTLPPETTGDRMTHPAGKIEATLATPVGLRTGLEDGFKHAQDDLGWADYRVSDFARIEGWGEVVMSAYPLLSLQSAEFAALGHLTP